MQWDKAEDPDDVQPGYGYVPADTAHHEDIFFYHSNHLGPTSYITDAKANITQFDAYLPYGELLVDEHSSSEEMPYKFNGKEFDEETGLYYYGARYMNPRTSLWYGVDPMTEKHPNAMGYNYCFNNPINYIDPLGEDTVNLLPPPSQDTRSYALKMDMKYFDSDDKVINIWAHGDKRGIETSDNGKIENASEFNQMLLKHSSVWKNRKGKEPIVIVLHACSTNEFAEALSKDKLFENVLIIAPNKKIQVRYTLG